MRRLRVYIATEAASQLAALTRRRRGMLRREMDRVAGSALYGPFVRIETPMDVAAGEAIDDPGILLVYAVIPRRDLLERIWGWGIEERLRLREGSRLTHGRGWDG